MGDKNTKKTLNDILDEYHVIESRIIENDGELDENLEELLHINTFELGDKLDGYENFIKYLDGQIDYLKNMESHYLKRKKVLENTKKKCKDSMVRGFSSTSLNKIKTQNYNFSICESESWSIDIDSIEEDVKEELVKDGLAQNIFKISLSDIKNKYKGQEENNKPNWITINKKKHIRTT